MALFQFSNNRWKPQEFRLFALKEFERFASSGNLAYQFGIDPPADLVRLLAVPFKAHERRREFSFKPIAACIDQLTKKNKPTSTTFLSLPVEVHQMIFESIDDVEDLMSFGLTCTYLWHLALPAMHDKWVSNMGLWVGKNIVLIGNRTVPGDYPPVLSSEQETIEVPLTGRVPEIFLPTGPLSLYDMSKIAYSTNVYPYLCDPGQTLTQCLLRGLSPREKLKVFDGPGVLPRFADLEEFNEKDFYPADERWILRNLTTKQYVRAEGIALRPEYIHGPRIEGFGFGHVVMTRIGWATNRRTGVDSPIKLTRGVWAGHRFDITTVAKHEEATKGEEWTDVSQEVADEMNVIFTAHLGADWKKHFMNRLVDERDSLLYARTLYVADNDFFDD